MPPILASLSVCSSCSEPLNVKGECLACLLRGGLNGSVEESAAERGSLVFSDFEIARREDGSFWELGSGAMGVTYRATDKVLHRIVALKVIETPAAAGDSQAVRERFLREARAAAALRHPNVAAVFQFGASPDGTRCYYAMELVEGETLGARVRRDGPLNAKEALEIAIQITRALMAAAAHGLIHRDLKPGNIMLTTESEVKVIDFGLAKAITGADVEMDLTHGEFVGTPSFASPEQFESGPIDARSDIYSLGATLWFALTGLAPHFGQTLDEIRQRQIHDKLPVEQLQGVPRRVIELLRSCLAVDPGERPASARVLLEALESYRAQSVPRRRTGKLVASAAMAVLALGIAALIFWRNREHDLALSAAVPEKSVAVLPFENLSEEKANAYFAEGVQNEILTKLAAVRDLKVISRTSTAKYKSKPDNLKTVAQELGVSTVLEGAVQKAGDKVRVNVQLIDARAGTQLWAKSYDRDFKDVLGVESEVSQKIAEALQANLSPSESNALGTTATRDT